MNKIILSLITISLFIVGCKKEPINPFEIKKQNIGLLTDSTTVKDLDAIFLNDSIVKFISGDEFTGSRNNIDVFEKGGKKLLTLVPSQSLDPLATIERIEIIDPRYKTEKNISILSTFKDVSTNYKISRINNLINSVVITVNEINANFVIDKEELPESIRYNMDLKIEVTHIPDTAKLKYFSLSWNNIK